MPEGATVRALQMADAGDALILYNELTVGPKSSDRSAFSNVIAHPGTVVHGAFLGGELVAMVTLHLLPNVLWGARPYGLIENVVTRAQFRGRGFGRLAIQAAIDAAWDANAFKIMLMTGQKRAAMGFYAALGFSREDKFAMVLRRT